MSHELGFVMGVHTRWLPMTRSHDPFPRRHSSHEILDVWANERRVVMILPPDSWRQKPSNARICIRGSYGTYYSILFSCLFLLKNQCNVFYQQKVDTIINYHKARGKRDSCWVKWDIRNFSFLDLILPFLNQKCLSCFTLHVELSPVSQWSKKRFF